MLSLASPWLILAAVVALGASHTYAYVKGGTARENSILAEQKRQDELVQKIQQSTAKQIASINVTHTTIRQKAEVITREVPIYTECRNDPAVSGLLDAARENRSPTESVSDRELPGVGTSSAPNVR